MMGLEKLQWYWHRLRAMSPAEVALHARRKVRQLADARRDRDWASVRLEASGAFPILRQPQDAPEVLRHALRRDAGNILAGRWQAFGHLELKVDDPPRWQCDYLAGRDLATTESAFKLDHRALPGGADIKLIWELSRWCQLVRLAMAAYVLDEQRATEKCLWWLEDWVKHNPPCRGWNWTSALESGLRLVQFAWIDALLAGKADAWGFANELDTLRYAILPPHAWFTWRHQSFGSSANNHLLGELAGLIFATVRWPALAQWGAPLEELQRRWEHEVLAQFAEDGGNREQALHYHLFAWEFCWQARAALCAAGRTIAPEVELRLENAAHFFWDVQARREPWDYGDSDNALVTPFCASEQTALCEWRDWISRNGPSSALEFWLGSPPASARPPGVGGPARAEALAGWWLYRTSGIAIYESGFWWLRWDLSPLGYLQTAAHAHLDALHLSIWCKGVALVIDPGTGAYYANQPLRAWLTSRAAHNGPCLPGRDFPQHLGPFLWSRHHAVPACENIGDGLVGMLRLPDCQIRRCVAASKDGSSWTIDDACVAGDGSAQAFTVRWQFAPGSWFKRLSERRFSVNRGDLGVTVEVSEAWAGVELAESAADEVHTIASRPAGPMFEGIVSPAFRKIEWGPFLKLFARPQPGKPGVFRTTFLVPNSSRDL